MNIHQYNSDFHYHLSVGAVVVNDQHQIALHFFEEVSGHKDIYYLMRSSLKPKERIEDAIERGLIEEMGISATPQHFIGDLFTEFYDNNGNIIRKTTLYYLFTLELFDITKRNQEHREANSEIVWMNLDEAVATLIEQLTRTGIGDISNEYKVLERAKELVK